MEEKGNPFTQYVNYMPMEPWVEQGRPYDILRESYRFTTSFSNFFSTVLYDRHVDFDKTTYPHAIIL